MGFFVRLLSDFLFLGKLAAPVGNRTRVPSLQVMCSTIELQEHLLRDFSFLAKLVLSEGFACKYYEHHHG